MHKPLLDKYRKAQEHYKRLMYEFEEGLIPADLYLEELKVMGDYLQGIYEQLQKLTAIIDIKEANNGASSRNDG